MTPKKYIWLDGSTHPNPDPKWNQELAKKLGLIPTSLQTVKGNDFAFQKNKQSIEEFVRTAGYDLPVGD